MTNSTSAKPTKKSLHIVELDVRWGDMDAVGHVNNATYFSYFEQTRIDWYGHLGLGDEANSQNEGPVLVTTSCTYLKEIIFPARIQVHMYGGDPGRSSYPSFYEVRDANNADTLYAEGKATTVWVDHIDGKAKPLPQALRAVLIDH
tara:strand:+ start:250 stop:687 length:438 start_codon:yes stop_codon:yes gene_type:complete